MVATYKIRVCATNHLDAKFAVPKWGRPLTPSNRIAYGEAKLSSGQLRAGSDGEAAVGLKFRMKVMIY